jgi:hypothetical protein
LKCAAEKTVGSGKMYEITEEISFVGIFGCGKEKEKLERFTADE